MMRYISTRGKAPVLGFEDVLLAGLASDGGLYVPEKLPFYTPETLASWSSLSYTELSFKVMYPFVEGAIPEADFRRIIQESYATFSHKAIAPLVQLDRNLWVLELFHGPTLAFKDFALQLLGRLLDYVLKKRKERVVIMGATSGDTGSAALEGCRHSDYVDMFILHPHKRVSDVQRRQMTTVLANNVFNIAMEGNFDDCQAIVKESFADQSFLKGRKLVAVNSINWARIMAQIVYYIYAALSLGAPARSVAFSVPTGNFGDIFAGYLARKMGLPITQLVVATNKNDILHRCISQNDYSRHALEHTLSPSMDIMVSSNFERLLFDLYDRDGVAIAKLMDDSKNGKMVIEPHRLEKARALFTSYSVDDKATIETIANVFKTCGGEILDPHTAVGVKAGIETWWDKTVPMIVLATAHPAKFSEAVKKAGLDEVGLPPHLSDLMSREERYEVLPNDPKAVREYVAQKIG
ncbi:MAG: threonine synthase [Rickettsiales bacterium]|jgi:threonine synthase|nr:threonine synthase [Rickettsiales bacterium]